MQPKISSGQVDTSFEGRLQQYQLIGKTKTNVFQELFIGGVYLEIYQADNTVNPDEFKVAGDYTLNFVNGTTFIIVGSTGNDGSYTTVQDATFASGYTTIYVANGTITTNEGAGLGTGFISTGERLVMPDLSTALIATYATARDTTTTGAGAGLIHRAAFIRDTGAATIARIGAVQSDLSRESMTGTPDVDLTADTTNGSIAISVKGGSTNLVDWQIYVVLNLLEQ